MSNKIYILSEPIQTGKTTLLTKWIKRTKQVAGILTPDINGTRKLYDIAGNQYHGLQLNELESGVSIGRFVFDKAAFEKARNILVQSLQQDCDWILVDEIGRLELDKKEGLEPAVTTLINAFKQSASDKKLLLVIRDYLLADAIAHYGLENATVLPRSFFGENIHHEPLNGLVLCGGKSVRMGSDKAFIVYHKQPQYAHIAGMMNALCDEVLISCNPQQKEQLNKSYEALVDSATFSNAGPLSGVLTAFETIPGSALLISGCDYPYFTFNDMLALTQAREPGVDVVCYRNTDTGFEEPLLAVYEKQCGPLLLRCFDEGYTSLRHFLKTVNTKYITTNNAHLKSIDEPGDN